MIKIVLTEREVEGLARFVDGGLKASGVALAEELSKFWPKVAEALREYQEDKKGE